ncbi:MAG TPA: hypothetical protein VGO35_00670 [Gammaproteobacteria bacterium]|nr:hypothetical protein [Gammaproteobacteria bacterium]
MRISPRPIWRGLLAAGFMLTAANTAQAAHSYIPFTLVQNPGPDQGVWLADTDHLGNPPFQLTNQPLDGNVGTNGGTVAILNDWTLNAITHEATGVTPQLAVYGVAGHLYKANLRNIGPIQQFSNGSYAQLCTLTALDERPYAAAKAYVQAVVEPTGSLNACASGIGTQTWLIPANADNTVAPIIEPTNWSVLGAFTNPVDESFVRWVVWTGNAVVAYKANFSSATTLLVGPPTGPAPAVFSRVDGTMFLTGTSDVAGTRTDSLYRVTMTGSSLVATYSFADTAICVGVSAGVMTDSIGGILSFAEPTGSGYAVYAAPLAGGAATQIYADSTGNECGALAGDTVSGSYVGLNEFDTTSGFDHVIALNETGPGTQTPVFLAGGVNIEADIRYTINGHFWIGVLDFNTSPTGFTEIVADGNGAVVQTYANSRMGDDIWGGYFVRGNPPGVERDVVYLFSPNPGVCMGGTLAAIDPVAFTSTNITGLPADACSALAYGWQPASVGYVREPAGSSPVEIDPVGGKMYSLLGPDAAGLFENLAILPGYPFY